MDPADSGTGPSSSPVPVDPRSSEGLLAAVASKGITDVDGIWQSVGKAGGIRSTLEGTSPPLQRADLLAGLLRFAAEAADVKGTPAWRRHGLDIAVAAGLVTVSLLVMRAIPLATAQGIAARDLRPGQRLRVEDILAAPSPHEVLNRPVLRRIAAGQPVYPHQLGEPVGLPATLLAGRVTLRLPIDGPEVPRLPTLPNTVSLLFAVAAREGQPGNGVIMLDVPVLSSTKQDGASFIIVALTARQLDAVRGFVHEGRVLVLNPTQ